jgi:hypothetical protein
MDEWMDWKNDLTRQGPMIERIIHMNEWLKKYQVMLAL